jgi:hypothetical protein
MKKFLFIIPNVVFYFTISIVLLLLINSKILAADGVDGCHIFTGGGQERLYWDPYPEGTGSPTRWIAGSVGTYAGAGASNYNKETTSKCFNDLGPACDVYKYGTTGVSPAPSEKLFSGTYAMFITCPIDDYIPFLFIFTVLIVMSKMRNLHQINESKFNHRSL